MTLDNFFATHSIFLFNSESCSSHKIATRFYIERNIGNALKKLRNSINQVMIVVSCNARKLGTLALSHRPANKFYDPLCLSSMVFARLAHAIEIYLAFSGLSLVLLNHLHRSDTRIHLPDMCSCIVHESEPFIWVQLLRNLSVRATVIPKRLLYVLSDFVVHS